MQGGSIPPSSTKSGIYQGKCTGWTKGSFPRPTALDDLGIPARSIRQTRYFVAVHRMLAIARDVTRTEFGRITSVVRRSKTSPVT